MGASIVVDSVVPIKLLVVVVDWVVVVVVGCWVGGVAEQYPSGGPASRQLSHVSTDLVHGVTAQQVQQQEPVVAYDNVNKHRMKIQLQS